MLFSPVKALVQCSKTRFMIMHHEGMKRLKRTNFPHLSENKYYTKNLAGFISTFIHLFIYVSFLVNTSVAKCNLCQDYKENHSGKQTTNKNELGFIENIADGVFFLCVGLFFFFLGGNFLSCKIFLSQQQQFHKICDI